MARSSQASFLGLLMVASSASATTLGPIQGSPVAGRPLEVNIPFAVDRPTDRACASANVRYSDVAVSGFTVDVQGRGLRRNLLVTSRVSVNQPTVTVGVRVGCGSKAVSRTYTMLTNMSGTKPAISQAASNVVMRSGAMPIALLTPREALFPPASEALTRRSHAQPADASVSEELRKAQAEAATAGAQLHAARKELAAVLDVERRTSQTLIEAQHEVRHAKSQLARLRVVLGLLGTAFVLVAAGAIWSQFDRAALRRRTSKAPAAQEPAMDPTPEVPTEGKPLAAGEHRRDVAVPAVAGGARDAVVSEPPEWLRAASCAAAVGGPIDATANGLPESTANSLPEWLRAASIAAAAGEPTDVAASRLPEWLRCQVAPVARSAGAT